MAAPKIGPRDVTALQTHTAKALQNKRPNLWDTATHCNTLQHTATHCNTLQNKVPNLWGTAKSLGLICLIFGALRNLAPKNRIRHKDFAVPQKVGHVLQSQRFGARDTAMSHVTHMGWLQLVGSLKLQVSFAEYHLCYRALLQKRPIILMSLLMVAIPYQCASVMSRVGMVHVTRMIESCNTYE